MKVAIVRGARATGAHWMRMVRLGLGIGLAAWFGMPAAADGAALIKAKCGACHLEGDKLQRISTMRKTPEGWEMTIARMGIWHKVELSREERRAVVKYLADNYGLAPAETAQHRALIERVPNSLDVSPSDEITTMCGRCHSAGRVALQRRDVVEWRKLVHTHIGQFPSTEYSNQGRDRNWLEIALGETSSKLGELYPYRTEAWTQWQSAKRRAPTGAWRVSGHRPGWGMYSGYMQVSALGGDRYRVKYDLQYDAGNRAVGDGETIVYTGYEWRGTAKLGNQDTRSVFALSADGKTLSGRWFLRNADEIGARFEAVRMDAVSAGTIVAVSPSLLKAGERATVHVAGVKLGSKFDFGPGVNVEKVERVSDHETILTLAVAPDATVGWRAIGRAPGKSEARVAIYKRIDTLRVEPEFAYAKLGGGTVAPVTAQFEAIAYLAGPDGKPNTEDDIRLGPVSANWSVDNFDERAKAENDVKFAGVMEPNGQFLPAFAGPNPARGNASNVGDLAVRASFKDGAEELTGNARLVVSAQRWNTPPLR